MGILKRIFWDRILKRPRAKVDHTESFSQQKQEHLPGSVAIGKCIHGLEIDSCSLCLGGVRERSPERTERRHAVERRDEELRSLVYMMIDKLSHLSRLENWETMEERIDAYSDDELLSLIGSVRAEVEPLSRDLKEWVKENQARFL
jgi:hypothetical protein